MNNFVDAPQVDVEGIAQYVFTKPPGPEKSIMLQLTSDSRDQFQNIEDLKEVYRDIALCGIEMLYQKGAFPFSMTADELRVIQSYMLSLGVALVITQKDLGDGRIMRKADIKFL